MLKSVVKPMNSSKNKLNSEIILIFHYYPNTHLITADSWFAKYFFPFFITNFFLQQKELEKDLM